MPSMSYVLFENTAIDLHACLEKIRDGDKLSESEEENKKYLVKLCTEILEEEGYQVTEPGDMSEEDPDWSKEDD